MAVARWRGYATLWALAWVGLAACAPRAQTPSFAARDGELDLGAWRPAEHGVVPLSGSWTFYWDQLLDPHTPGLQPASVRVPGQWVNGVEGAPAHAAHGAATYVLQIQLPPERQNLALHLPEPNLAHRLWVDGQLASTRGRPARSADGEVGSLGGVVVPLSNLGERVELRLQLSNHGSRSGGLQSAPVIGPREDIVGAHTHAAVSSALLFGVLLAVALYHLGIFTMTPAASAHLWFALSTLAVATHMLVVDPNTLLFLLGVELPWQWVLRVEYLALYASVPLGLMIFARMFPQDVGNAPNRPLLVATSLSVAVPLLTPATFYTRTLLPVSLLGFFCMLWITALLTMAVARRRPFARIALASMIVFLIANLHDFLAVHGVVDSTGVALRGPGLLAFVGAQAWLLAKGYADSQVHLGQVSQALVRSNAQLVRTNRSIERFVPHEVFGLLRRRTITEVERGDHVGLEMGVLFCDIRGFTTAVEAMRPGPAFAFINDYLSYMEPPIHDGGGFINQYLGDGIMALFETGADGAVCAGVNMVRQLECFNRRQRHVQGDVRAGIGVHCGPLMLGTIGSQRRLDTGVVGDAVNHAARLESLTRDYGTAMVISERTVAQLSRPLRVRLRELDRVALKGMSEQVRIYEVLDALPADVLARRQRSWVQFEAGLHALRSRDWPTARRCFERCVEVDPTDVPARRYLRTCRAPSSPPPGLSSPAPTSPH